MEVENMIVSGVNEVTMCNAKKTEDSKYPNRFPNNGGMISVNQATKVSISDFTGNGNVKLFTKDVGNATFPVNNLTKTIDIPEGCTGLIFLLADIRSNQVATFSFELLK